MAFYQSEQPIYKEYGLEGGLLHGGGLIFQTSYCYHPKRMLELRPQLPGASSPLVEPDSSRLSCSVVRAEL